MLIFRRTIIFFFLVLMFASCNAYRDWYYGIYVKKIDFDPNKDLPVLLTNIPAIAKDLTMLNSMDKIKAVNVYSGKLEERLVEKNHVLDHSVENASSPHSAPYKSMDGSFQKIYLLELISEKPTLNIPVIYLSVRYNGMGDCSGLGSSYIGYLQRKKQKSGPSIFNIHYQTELKGVIHEKKYVLENAGNTDLLFVLNDSLSTNKLPCVLKKVVLSSANKIGGEMPLVYDVDNEFQKKNAITFETVMNVNLIP